MDRVSKQYAILAAHREETSFYRGIPIVQEFLLEPGIRAGDEDGITVDLVPFKTKIPRGIEVLIVKTVKAGDYSRNDH
jgi:hypothetical protein